MKKFKMLAFGIGLMLSIVTVFANPSPLTTYGVKVNDCPNAIPVDDDCQSSHSGATCQIDFVDIAQVNACSVLLKRTN